MKNYHLPKTWFTPVRLLWAAVLTLVFTACATTPGTGVPPDLDAWVDGELAPYLAQELGKHPKFKGQPVLLVGMHGDDVEARIDLLTDDIRAKLLAPLVQVPGVKLAWRPSARPWRHRRSLADVRCGDDDSNVHYYIGIDIASAANDRARVLVRALDLQEGGWVTGFGKDWSGRLSADETARLAQQQPDEHLRGLRPLPFEAHKPDLVAAYLARNLSCLLRRRGDEALRLYRQPVAAVPPFFRTTLDLVANYLSQFREVQVVDDPEAATAVLKGELHPLGKGLYQLWVVTRFKQDAARLAGTDTEVYVHASPADLRPAPPAPVPPPVAIPAPVPAPAPAPAPAPTVVPPPAPQPSAPAPADLATSFTVVTPIDQAFCTTSTPWLMGKREAGRQAVLPARGCFALALVPKRDAWLVLLYRDPAGRLSRLIPSDCPGGSQTRVEAGHEVRFPDFSAADGPIIDLVDAPGVERFYALLTRDRVQGERLRALVASLPSVCREEEGADGAYWMPRIQRLIKASGGKIDQRTASVRQQGH